MGKRYFNNGTLLRNYNFRYRHWSNLVLIGFINNSYSQYFRCWVLRYQYPEFNSEPYSFTKDNGGNVFLTGKLRPDDLNSLNYSTISLGMNKCADMIFENNFNQTNDIDYGKDIAFDNNNNLYILGFYWGGAVNKGEFFLRKFTNYLTQWNYQGIHDWKDCEPYRVAVDNNGNAYVSLWSYVINPEYDDFALIKLTNSGELSWLRTYKDNSFEQTEDMAMDNSGNIIIVGGSGTNTENFDIKVIKYDSDGNLLFDLLNYPNPFNPTTKISFNLPTNSYVRLAVYNIIGQEVKVLMNGRMTSGYKEIQFDGSFLSSGVYFYRLYVRDENKNNYSVTNKFLLIK